MIGILTRMFCAAAGIALAASGVASAGAAGADGTARTAVRVPVPAGGPLPVTAYVAGGLFKGKVTPIRTATDTVLPAIAVGSHRDHP